MSYDIRCQNVLIGSSLSVKNTAQTTKLVIVFEYQISLSLILSPFALTIMHSAVSGIWHAPAVAEAFDFLRDEPESTECL